jgi:hypothetical protein
MTLLPTGIIALLVTMNIHIMDVEGFEYMYGNYNIAATQITMMIMLMFQFMSGVYSGEYIFEDMRCDRRWRLRAAPVSAASYVFGAIAASMIFTLFSAAFILTVGFFVFDVYLGNIAVIAAVTFFSALMAQFIGIIIAYFVAKKRSIDGITIVLSFAMSSMVGGFFINIPIPVFVQDYIVPTGIALRAVFATSAEPLTRIWRAEVLEPIDSIIGIGILAGIVVALGIATLIIARRKKS